MASDLTVGGAGYCGLTTLGECQRLALEHLKSRSEVKVYITTTIRGFSVRPDVLKLLNKMSVSELADLSQLSKSYISELARNGQGAKTVPVHHAVRHDVRGPHFIGY